MLFFCFSFYCGGFTLIAYNRIDGVMVSVFATRLVDHGFESKSGKTRVNGFFFFRYSHITVKCN